MLTHKFFESHNPDLEEIKSKLSASDGLCKYFKDVSVEVVDCPDFKQEPYNLAITGLNGKPRIADVGGVHNLEPLVNLDAKFSFSDVTRMVYKDDEYPVSLIGPGAGPFHELGYNSELMASAVHGVSSGPVNCMCRYAFVNERGGSQWADIKQDAFGLMANFYMSQDKPGQVLKINVKQRIGKLNFTESVRQVMKDNYGDKPVSMGGVFLINAGTVKLHVMPKHWPDQPSTEEMIGKWLKFYEVDGHPLVCLSVFHSHDPGYGLRMEHTHCYNLSRESDAGHYHYDITPDTIEYEAYFQVAQQVHRIGGPSDPKQTKSMLD